MKHLLPYMFLCLAALLPAACGEKQEKGGGHSEEAARVIAAHGGRGFRMTYGNSTDERKAAQRSRRFAYLIPDKGLVVDFQLMGHAKKRDIYGITVSTWREQGGKMAYMPVRLMKTGEGMAEAPTDYYDPVLFHVPSEGKAAYVSEKNAQHGFHFFLTEDEKIKEKAEALLADSAYMPLFDYIYGDR